MTFGKLDRLGEVNVPIAIKVDRRAAAENADQAVNEAPSAEGEIVMLPPIKNGPTLAI